MRRLLLILVPSVAVGQQAQPNPAADLTWSGIFKQFAVSAAEGGPTLAFAALLILGMFWVISKTIWPWLTKTAARALDEAELSREARDEERRDAQAKFVETLRLHEQAIEEHRESFRELATAIEKSGTAHQHELIRVVDSLTALTQSVLQIPCNTMTTP